MAAGHAVGLGSGARLNDNALVDDSATGSHDAADHVAESERLLASAERLFRSGELQASGETAIRAGELARLAGRPDLLASAALIVTGVEDPLIDAGVESMCRDALETGIGLLVTLLVRTQRLRQRMLAFGLSDHYRQILSLTRLDEAIAVVESEEAALASGS
jgi:hypothetical protein